MTMRRGLQYGLLGCGALLASVLGAWAADVAMVTQANRKFTPSQVEVARGGTVRFVNDDGQLLHHIYSTSPTFDFDSGEQAPGKVIEERFNVPGTFTVLCGIHPKMRLVVTVH